MKRFEYNIEKYREEQHRKITLEHDIETLKT